MIAELDRLAGAVVASAHLLVVLYFHGVFQGTDGSRSRRPVKGAFLNPLDIDHKRNAAAGKHIPRRPADR